MIMTGVVAAFKKILTWVAQAALGSKDWTNVSINTDATSILCTVTNSGYVYRSTDKGATWQTLTSLGGGNWTGVCQSDDGRIIVCIHSAYNAGLIMISYDYGLTWATKKSGKFYGYACCSSDGRYIYVSSFSNYSYKSSDYGATWTTAVWGLVKSISCSGDGRYVVLKYDESGNAVRSTDYGATWVASDSSYTQSNTAISNDGSVMYRALQGGNVRKSVDYGESFVSLPNSPSGLSVDGPSSVATSGDGRVVVVVTTNGGTTKGVFVSTDYGATWAQQTVLGTTTYWMACAVSRDGAVIGVLPSLASGVSPYLYI